MINAERYRHTGRTYVNISGALQIIWLLFLGLTPQAKYLSPLCGSLPRTLTAAAVSCRCRPSRGRTS